MRASQHESLEDGIQQDSHQQKVHHGLEARPQQFSARISIEENAGEIRWTPRSRVGHTASDTEGDRNRRMQDEPEPTGTGEALRDSSRNATENR
jgi:hypothetical protein